MPNYTVKVESPSGDAGDNISVVAPTEELAIEAVKSQLGPDFADWNFSIGD